MKCPKCHRSTRVYKFGFRPRWNKGKRTLKQAYQCDNCGHQFCEK